MKTFINKINQHLLERYPTIWNTKIVWMFGIALIIHILFFVLGFTLFTNIELLHERGASTLFFENGTVFFSIMVTLIMLVVWLSQLFKNNAFKNFYPINNWRLFGQFFQYFLIILVSSSFYYSYSFGLKSYINLKFEDIEFKSDIAIANDAAVFLSHNLAAYKVKNRKYPQPFDTIYCETRNNFIDFNEKTYTYLGNDFQFYTLSKKEKLQDEGYYYAKDYQGHVFSKQTDSSTIYYFRDKVLKTEDVYINYTNTAVDSALIYKPSYYNFSGSFFDIQSNSSNSLSYYLYTSGRENTAPKSIENNKYVYELLQRNDKQEITAILERFLGLADKFEIDYDLNVANWSSLIFREKGFQVSALIQDDYPDDVRLYNNKEQSEYEKYVDRITTKSYIKSENLFYVFNNINDIKKARVLNETIHIFLWLAFFLSALIFAFRVTSVRVFILSIVAAALLLIVIGLAIVVCNYAFRGMMNSDFYNFSFNIFIGLVILVIPFVLLHKIRKTVTGIFMNISIVGFPILLLLIIGLISTIEREVCLSKYDYYADCPSIFRDQEFNISFLILFLSFAFIFLYTNFIKKWRAIPKK